MIKVEVIFMLHNEERHLIIQALNHHIPVKEIAECFYKHYLPLTQADGNDRLCGNPYLSARPQTCSFQ